MVSVRIRARMRVNARFRVRVKVNVRERVKVAAGEVRLRATVRLSGVSGNVAVRVSKW